MENNKKLVYLSVDAISEHPDNPRKNLGDLEELAESIRAKGIMQNLTVVPFESKTNPSGNYDGHYTVIIGHRRLAAAKLAGISEVPCVIVEMSEKEQLATMLLENMQRSDLTIYEQAKGFQMMLDLGDTVAGISEKSGFSETTIRRRVKLAELDEKKLREASERQITMAELDELNKVEDVKDRNELLSDIGTSNFKWRVQSKLASQKMRAEQAEAREKLLELGLEEVPYSEVYGNNGYGRSERCWIYLEDIKAYKQKDDEELFAINHNSVYFLYKISEELQEDKAKFFAEQEKRKQEEAFKRTQLEELFERAFYMRCEFCRNLSKTTIMKKFDKIVAFLFLMAADDVGGYPDEEEFCDFLGIDLDEKGENDERIKLSEVEESLSGSSQEEGIWRYLCLRFSDRKDKNCINLNRRYYKNHDLVVWYEFLVSLGYDMSDEEKALLDGTHELYAREE